MSTAGAVLDADSARVLEVGRLLRVVAHHAETAMGRRRLLDLSPTDDADELARRHRLADEARAWIAHAGLGLAAAEDLGPVLASVATEGVVLEPGELLRVLCTARVAEGARRRLGGGAEEQEEFPGLVAIAAGIPDLGRLVDQIEALLTAEGEVRDDASPELQRLRRRRRSLRDSLRRGMEELVQREAVERVLQDTVVSQRGGRYVVPLRAEHKGALKGVVHDSSSSGQTLWVEPLEILDEQNELVATGKAEEEEVRRLLAEATAHVRAARGALSRAQAAIAELDALQGVARYGRRLGAVTPRFVDGGLRLVGARHPLMVDPLAVDPQVVGGPSPAAGDAGDDRGSISGSGADERDEPGEGDDRDQAAAGEPAVSDFVPIDLELDPEAGILVITGPNTGGKTVVLKTVGVAAAMAQCGLPVPSRQAALPLFSRIHADIGDEQSIVANLSTFSSHLTKIIGFLEDCPPDSLVLLDELGTGTDPAEGSALGIALLERFVSQGALTLTSTHHDALKAFAHGHPRAVNAAVEFDSKTLEPTYRLRVGRPGRSNALEIAGRLGLGADLVDRARSLLEGQSVELDSLLRQLDVQSEELDTAQAGLREQRRRLEEAGRQRQRAVERLEEERRELQQRGREAIEEVAEELRRAGESFLAELREEIGEAMSRRSLQDRRASWAARVGEARGRALDRIGGRLEDGAADRDVEGAGTEASPQHAGPEASPEGAGQEAPPQGAGLEAPPRSTGSLRRGEPVSVRSLGLQGTVAAAWDPETDDPESVEVDVGGKRLIAARDDVHRRAEAPRSASGAGDGTGGGTRYERKADVAAEILLVGKTVDEAIARADKYLDDALLAQRPSVRLIHGHGTGRLRRGLREWLRDRPGIAGFGDGEPSEGGSGVTVVQLDV